MPDRDWDYVYCNRMTAIVVNYTHADFWGDEYVAVVVAGWGDDEWLARIDNLTTIFPEGGEDA